jgi:hypothetical protein
MHVLELSKKEAATLAKALSTPAPAASERLKDIMRRASAWRALTPEEVEANRRTAYQYAF